MRYVLLAFLLSACGSVQNLAPPQTVTITKTVPVYPPDSLYAEKSGCAAAPKLASGTVRDALNSSISKDAAIATCLGDRAAMRQWKADNKKGNK